MLVDHIEWPQNPPVVLIELVVRRLHMVRVLGRQPVDHCRGAEPLECAPLSGAPKPSWRHSRWTALVAVHSMSPGGLRPPDTLVTLRRMHWLTDSIDGWSLGSP